MNCPSFQWAFEAFAFPFTQSEKLVPPSVPFRHGVSASGGPTPPFVHWSRFAARLAAPAGWANMATAGMLSPAAMAVMISTRSTRRGREKIRNTLNPTLYEPIPKDTPLGVSRAKYRTPILKGKPEWQFWGAALAGLCSIVRRLRSLVLFFAVMPGQHPSRLQRSGPWPSPRRCPGGWRAGDRAAAAENAMNRVSRRVAGAAALLARPRPPTGSR